MRFFVGKNSKNSLQFYDKNFNINVIIKESKDSSDCYEEKE
mgnify:CR=1 FL=1